MNFESGVLKQQRVTVVVTLCGFCLVLLIVDTLFSAYSQLHTQETRLESHLNLQQALLSKALAKPMNGRAYQSEKENLFETFSLYSQKSAIEIILLRLDGNTLAYEYTSDTRRKSHLDTPPINAEENPHLKREILNAFKLRVESGTYSNYSNRWTLSAYQTATIDNQNYALVNRVSLLNTLSPVLFNAALLAFTLIPLTYLILVRFEVVANALIQEILDKKKVLKQTIKIESENINSIVNTAVSSIISIDEIGIILSVNPSAVKMFGYEAEEIIGRNISVLVDNPKTSRDHDQYLKQFLKTGDAKIIGVGRETRAVRKSGETFPIHLSVGHIRNHDGKDQFVGFIDDISEYERTLNELKESRIRLSIVLNSVSSIIFMKDLQGRYQLVNQQFAERLGQPVDGIIGKTDMELMSSKQAKKLREADFKVLKQDKPLSIEEHVIDHENDERWYWSEKVAIKNDAGQVIGICGISTDITQSKRLQNKLKISEEKFRSLVDNIPGITYRAIFKSERHPVFISDAIHELTGREPNVFLDQGNYSLDDIVFQADKPHVLSTILDAKERNGSYALEYRIVTKELYIRWVSEKGRCSYHKESDRYFIDAAIFDITDSKESERKLTLAVEEAEAASLSKAMFLANMSHEIRTPLNAIIGFNEVVLQGSLKQDQRKHLTIASNSAHSLLSIINDILDVSKIESGKFSLEHIDFSLVQVINECVETLQQQAADKGLHLSAEVAPELPNYHIGDPHRLKQIIINLLGNGIKFTDSGSVVINVRSSPSDDKSILFRVRDTGMGMTEKEQSRVFQPFTQADESTSRRFGGTGLGTTISQQLVTLMGGKIWLQSAPGKGSEFHFIIPLTKSEHQSESHYLAMPQTQKIPNGVQRKLNILLAEDIKENAQLAQLRLTERGHRVTWVENGRLALEATDSEDFDIVLMDIQMPEMDGLASSLALRLKGINVPIIALTASVMENEKQSCFDSGMNAIIAKPIVFEKLFSEMERLVYYQISKGDTYEQHQPHSEDLADLNFLSDIVDTKRALETWRSAKAYLKSLQHFAQTRSNIGKEIQSQIIRNQIADAKASCHALKGVSANLFLTEIRDIVERIEIELEHNALDKAELFTLQLEPLLKLLIDLPQFTLRDSTSALVPKPTYREILHPKINYLLHALEIEDLDGAETALNELTAEIGEPICSNISMALFNFEFDQASIACNQLMQSISESPNGES